MALNALKNDVYSAIQSQLKMRNLRDTVITKINTITLYVHSRRFFERDVKYFQMDVTAPAFAVQASLTSVANMRGISYLAVIGESGNTYEMSKASTIGQMLGADQCAPAQSASFARMGQNLSIHAPEKITTILVGAVTFPDVTDASYNSWIADLYPDVIQERVLYRVKSDIGDTTVKGHADAAAQALISLYGDQPTVNLLC